MRFYRLDHWDGGERPTDYPLPDGAIVRVKTKGSPLPGAVFNSEAGEWVFPCWIECADPSQAAT